jgi:hypothetical protein
MLATSQYFGLETLEELDGWMELQMARADKILARAAQAMAELRDAPETQRLLLKVPRWLPLSGMLHAQLSLSAQSHQAIALRVPGHKQRRATRAAPPTAPAQKSNAKPARPRTPPIGTAPAPAFSRKALAMNNPSALPPRVYSDEDLFQLQFSPEPKVFSRRAYAASAAQIAHTLDDETLESLACAEVTASKDVYRSTAARTASEASTNVHDSPPSDMLSAFNPVLPGRDVADLFHSVGTLFDTGTNPA